MEWISVGHLNIIRILLGAKNVVIHTSWGQAHGHQHVADVVIVMYLIYDYKLCIIELPN